MAGSKEEYRAREIEFLGKRRHVVLYDADTWCPLVAVSNVLLLREKEIPKRIIFHSRAHGEKYIEQCMLEDLVDIFLERGVYSLVKDGRCTQRIADLVLRRFREYIPHLSTQFAVFPKFTSTEDFVRTSEKILYDMLGIKIYHDLLVNPQDTGTSLGLESYDQLLHEVDKWKKSECKGDPHRMSLIQNFLNSHQLTSYGLAHLCKDVAEGVVSLLFKDDQISVLYKHRGTLHILVTAEHILENYPDAMWKKLENVDDGGDLVTSTFGPINVNWRENERSLIEDERKAVKQKGTSHLKKSKNAKKHQRRKDKMNTVTQDESGEANKDLGDEAEASTPEDKGPASPKDGVLGPSQDNIWKDRFMKFLKEYLLDGKSYFKYQVESMQLLGSFHLIICYGWIKTYDKELAVSICNNYYRFAEDLRLCFCDYFHSVIQEKSVDMDKGELYAKIKLTICCRAEHKRFLSFEEFAKENCMYIVYELHGRFVNSTSYVGRMMALGYLRCILKMHKYGNSWNGMYDESHMSVKIVKGVMIFKIKTIASMVTLNRDTAVNDFDTYKKILFPLFKRPDVEGYPAYFNEFVQDFMDMPDPIKSPVEFEKFQKYMGEHLFAKAPLVRSGLITNTYQVCESLVIERPQPGSWPVYDPLDLGDTELPEWDREAMSAAMNEVYTYKQSSSTTTDSHNRFDKHTYWCALMLARHGVQHLHWYTKKENKQTIQDFVIVDLTIGHDLKGVIARVVHKIMMTNNFDGPFSSVWRTFMASETLDEPAKDAAVEDGETETGGTVAAPGPATATISGSAPQPPPLKLNCKGVDLSCNDLSCLEDRKDVFDSVIDFVYARISLQVASHKDILLVPPNLAYLMGNLTKKADLELHAKSLDLKSRRMVLVPVNDNTDYMRADGGKHWSLLVIQIAEDHSSCRFVHHDSLSSCLNHTAAVKYANALRQVLPEALPVIEEADTPKQLNGSDCSLCVLALSHAICTWWIRRGHSGISNCWVEEVNSKITGQTYVDMRVKLRQNLMEEMRALALATVTAAALDLATAKSAPSGPSTDPAARPPTAPFLKLKCKVQDRVVELFCKDLSCLEDGSYVVDSVINFVCARISLTFHSQQDLLLLPPMHAFLMGRDKKTDAEVEAEAKSLDLNTRRMVLVPVDGNMDSMCADSKRHWSLLVIHIGEDLSCRFVHHDSLDGVNHNAAVEYANAFRRVLPEAQPVTEVLIPGQLNASDGGLCVLALIKAICTWWVTSRRSGASNCWVEEVNSKVTVHTVAAMRAKLRQNLMKEMQALASDPTN